MYGFHFLVWFLCVRGIRDTQVRVFIILSEGCHLKNQVIFAEL